MNITFLIGNGFDLNLKLKTKYEDFYPHYLKKYPGSMIAKDIAKNYASWADMELGLGKLLANVSPKEASDFLSEKEDLDGELALYLRTEESRIDLSSPTILQEFQEKVSGFYKEFSRRDLEHFTAWQRGIKEPIKYQFISFNYTNTLDRIIDPATKNKQFSTHNTPGQGYHDVVTPVLHLHGTLDDGMILALDNENQIANPELRTISSFTRYMLKSQMNNNSGEQKTELARKVIDDSDYVCIYGMSLGETDTMWWKYLAKWVQQKDVRRIVLYIYEAPTTNPSASRKQRQQDNWKDKFLKVAQIPEDAWEKLYSRIIVLLCSNIFNFGDLNYCEQAEQPALANV